MGFDQAAVNEIDGQDITPNSVDAGQLSVGDDDKIILDDDEDTYLVYNSNDSEWILTLDGTIVLRANDFRDGITLPAWVQVTNEMRFGGGSTLDLNDQTRVNNARAVEYTPTDVRNLSGLGAGLTAYHDGSGTNTEGLASYNGTNWISQVDGTTIS